MHKAAQVRGSAVLQPMPHGPRHGDTSHEKAAGCRTLLDILPHGKRRVVQTVRRSEKHARSAQQLESLASAALLDLRLREASLPAASRASCGP